MGRKPKSFTNEGASSPPLANTTVKYTEDVEGTSESGTVTTNTFITSETITIPTLNGTQTFTTTDKVQIAYSSIEPLVIQEMQWALNEINRCNDYIYAKADLDRRFSVYRDELYDYRYRIRQLSLIPNYPNISESRFPQRPDYVADV